MRRVIAPLVVLVTLAACEAEIGNGAAADENISAEGRSEENVMSISAPGFDMKIEIPQSIRSAAEVDGDSELIYPGASLAGMHVQGGGQTGSVELRFNTPDPMDRVAAWYRDGARTGFRVDDAVREGTALVLEGHETGENGSFKLRLQPGDGSGTQGVLSLQGK